MYTHILVGHVFTFFYSNDHWETILALPSWIYKRVWKDCQAAPKPSSPHCVRVPWKTMGTRIAWRRFFYTTLRYMCTWRNWNHQHHHPTTSMKPNSGSCSSTSEKHPQVWVSFWDLLPWHTDDSRCLQRWFHTACNLKILKHHRVSMCLLLSLYIIFRCSRTHYLCELRTLQPGIPSGQTLFHCISHTSL